MKTRIFIDFWNFQLSLNDFAPANYRADWKKVSPWLIQQATAIVGSPLTYEGTHVYVSHDPKNKKDRPLRDFALNVLDRFPGIHVTLLERKAKGSPHCPACHQPIDTCPHCGSAVTGTIEKGVDTAIVTDILKLAWEGALGIAILVSSDRDFIPAVDLLTAKGYRVINAHFPPQGMHLARTCWANIDLKTGLDNFAR
jgi:uncharacterized LabA/DUF88 family protein